MTVALSTLLGQQLYFRLFFSRLVITPLHLPLEIGFGLSRRWEDWRYIYFIEKDALLFHVEILDKYPIGFFFTE